MRIYLDHNATGVLRPEALAAMASAHDAGVGNPSSLHEEGRRARALIEGAREEVARLLNARTRDVVFTSGGSEAIAAAVHGVVSRTSTPRGRIVVSTVEHSAVLEAARAATGFGCEVIAVACDGDGRVDAGAFAAALDDRTALAALQSANNETGVLQPVRDVFASCRAAGVPLLVDAVQVAGKLAIDSALEGDLVAISGHKLGGPQGTGALVVREGLALAPLIAGGAQERRRRGGTEATVSIAGFGAAAKAAARSMRDEAARLTRLRERFESELCLRFPDVTIHGSGAARLPNTSNFAIPHVDGETVTIALDLRGFAVATGSACASGAVEPSHVIRAMGRSEGEARQAVRVSTGWSTTEQDLDALLDALVAVCDKVRGGRLVP